MCLAGNVEKKQRLRLLFGHRAQWLGNGEPNESGGASENPATEAPARPPR